MIRRNIAGRALGAALMTAALAMAGPATTANAANEVPRRICDYDWREGTWHIKQLIKCAARHWNSPGAPLKAIQVAHCESELRPRAYNPNGYAGLFQQATRYWPDRADHWGQPDRSVFNGRANVIVSIRMAASTNSWSDWAGCA
jgi:hypothetical protein